MQIKWAQKRDAGMYECQVCYRVLQYRYKKLANFEFSNFITTKCLFADIDGTN